MKHLILLLSFAVQSGIGHSRCVHEQVVYGLNLFESSEGHNAYILGDDNRFVLSKDKMINPFKQYTVQYIKENHDKKNFDRYNRKYIEYYRYSHVQSFVKNTKEGFSKLGYESVVVGKSLRGRELFSIRPIHFNPQKKTIVMFGRHHGDEGTANWIIEGFVEEFLNTSSDFHDEFQLVLYPMINPDGAEEQSRYNDNDRDLNRSWSMDPSKTYDEAKLIHRSLKNYLTNPEQVVIALDMHGSFTKDFIYRVEDDYVTRGFYNHQQEFIDHLASYDIWQKGRFELSNGHKKMARIVLINGYGVNALTHETPRDIKIKNSDSRSKLSLAAQGAGILSVLNDIY